jgi:small subunit ribosomal protein S20
VAHSKSARKRIRQSDTARLRNRRRKAAVKDAIRQFDAAVAEGNTDDAAEKLKVVYKRLDTTAAKGTIHKNAASRAKARLAVRLNRAASK